jgi:disulfide bond formation protein DsbB
MQEMRHILGRSSPRWRAAQRSVLYLAWAQASIATMGSLYFSEVMDLVPCVLCWYQRILMYPLVAILTVGIIRRDRGVWIYALPLSILGAAIAAYHNLLYYGVLPESAQPCRLGISCTTRQIEWFGFLTIPLMSLIAFAVINLALALYIFWKVAPDDESEADQSHR